MKKRHIAGWIMALLTAASAAGFLAWTSTRAEPMAEALEALASDASVSVEYRDWWTFRPVGSQSNRGFLFYPGGSVDPRAYAPLMKFVASQGFISVLVPMPLTLAVLAPGKADEVMKAFPPGMTWVLGGHAQGGATALAYAKDHPDLVAGVVLMASFPPEGMDVSAAPFRILSIYGEKDGIVTRDRIQQTRNLLPPGTAWVEIKGGNHSQFAWYGQQSGDNLPEITREVQQQTLYGALGPFLRGVP